MQKIILSLLFCVFSLNIFCAVSNRTIYIESIGQNVPIDRLTLKSLYVIKNGNDPFKKHASKVVNAFIGFPTIMFGWAAIEQQSSLVIFAFLFMGASWIAGLKKLKKTNLEIMHEVNLLIKD